MDKSRKLASLAQLLYLANLLAIPVLALIILCMLLFAFRNTLDSLSRYHFKLAVLSGGMGLLILGIPPLSFWLLGYTGAEAWTTLLLFLIVIHTSLVMFGIFALARAMSGRKLQN